MGDMIQPVASYGTVHDRDITNTLDGLDRGARYLGSDLYERYSKIAREAGRVPGHKVAVGQAWTRLGLRRCSVTVGGPGRGKGRRGQGTQVIAWEIPLGFR